MHPTHSPSDPSQLFESLLVDHDPAVNYANWSYYAGVGNDPRDRSFRTVSQGEQYDPRAEHVAAWLPELACLSLQLRHRPWSASAEECAKAGFRPGEDYPQPMVDPTQQIRV